jgi:hypothetical protein
MEDERLFRFDLERHVPGGDDVLDAWLVVQTGEAAEYDAYNVVQRYLKAEQIAGRYRVVTYGQYGPSVHEYEATARTVWAIEVRDLKAPAEAAA